MQLDREFFQFRASARMKAPDDRILVLLGQPIERGHDPNQTLWDIHILGAVGGDQEKLSLSDPQSIQDITAVDIGLVMLQNFENRIAGDKDSLVVDPFAEQVHAATLDIRQQPGTRMIDDLPIPLLGYPEVKTTIAGLHVKDRYAFLLGHNRGQSAVGIAQD